MRTYSQYRIKGTAESNNAWFCDCPHCDGHDSKTTEKVDFIFEAIDEEHAKNLAQREISNFTQWLDIDVFPASEQPPKKPLPRSIELELLERWNNGLGLTEGHVAIICEAVRE